MSKPRALATRLISHCPKPSCYQLPVSHLRQTLGRRYAHNQQKLVKAAIEASTRSKPGRETSFTGMSRSAIGHITNSLNFPLLPGNTLSCQLLSRVHLTKCLRHLRPFTHVTISKKTHAIPQISILANDYVDKTVIAVLHYQVPDDANIYESAALEGKEKPDCSNSKSNASGNARSLRRRRLFCHQAPMYGVLCFTARKGNHQTKSRRANLFLDLEISSTLVLSTTCFT